MILHKGERVYWGAPEVIYLEGTITDLDAANQAAQVHIERATSNSAHLIGTTIPFAADGLTPLQGESPAGTTSEQNTGKQAIAPLSDAEKIRCAAAVVVHQKYGTTLSDEQRQTMISQVAQVLEDDPAMRERIITSMDQVLKRESLN